VPLGTEGSQWLSSRDLIRMRPEDVLLGAVLALLFVFVCQCSQRQTEAVREEVVNPWVRPWYPVNYWERIPSFAEDAQGAWPLATRERIPPYVNERVAIYPNAWISPWAYGRYVGYG
jgi:hypothetical protein